jgi:hypothetical protein
MARYFCRHHVPRKMGTFAIWFRLFDGGKRVAEVFGPVFGLRRPGKMSHPGINC